MNLSSNKILELIIKVYEECNCCNISVLGKNKRKIHRDRSIRFINKIHDNLKEYFNNELEDITIEVFSSKERNKYFKRNELLFDINVCKLGSFYSSKSIEPIKYVKESLVQIESEFKNDIRDVAIDFSKLVCGSSKLKILIISEVHNADNFIKKLDYIANNIDISNDKELYLIQLKHPREWSNSSKDSYKLYKYKNGWSTYNLK